MNKTPEVVLGILYFGYQVIQSKLVNERQIKNVNPCAIN